MFYCVGFWTRVGLISSPQSKNRRSTGGLSAFGFNMAALDYGCHCSAILTGQYHGHGQAVDPLDAVCKEYLGCIRCVKKQTQCEKIDVSDRAYGLIDRRPVHSNQLFTV